MPRRFHLATHCVRIACGSVCLMIFMATIAQAADAPVVPPKTGTSETIKLFNGRDLDGWHGNKDLWSVKDGVIVGKNTQPVKVSTYLLTDRNFGRSLPALSATLTVFCWRRDLKCG